jgi:hypothetical protein
MFVTETTMGDDHCFFAPQARACDMALQIPSKRFHFRSLSSGRSSLMYITDALQRWDDEDWHFVENTIARELSTSTMTLGGIMDGLVILELPASTTSQATYC